MSIEEEALRTADWERRRKEEGTVQMLVQLQEKQEDEAAMLLGNIKHKVRYCCHSSTSNITDCPRTNSVH